MCADGQESLELFVIIFGISNVRPIVMREFFFSRLQTEFFFCFQVSFCPVRRENRVGSSWNESDYSGRGTQISFLSRESQLREFRTSSFFNCVATKLAHLIKIGPLFDQICFSSKKIEKSANPKFSQLPPSRGEKLVWLPLRE